MKKRSQSSIRSKTLQSQEDQSDSNYWMGNIQAKKMLTKAGQKIASSMVEQSNKQNHESINHTYQSVHELAECSQTVHHTPTTNKTGNIHRNNAASYTQLHATPNSIIINYKNSPNFPTNSKNLGPFNYVQQYYQVQIDSLNSKILQMGNQLKKYRELYSSKQSQIEDLNEGLSSRISKENNQKNMLIKQINSNNIEIKRLKQQINLHKSEKQTLKIFLKQKQTTIEELNNSIMQIQIKKKKVEGYEVQLRESHNTLKQIEIQMNKLRAEAQRKDMVISNSNNKISSLESKLVQYQQDIKQLQKCVIGFKQSSFASTHKIEQAENQCQEWKNKYCEVKQQLGQIPQLEIKLKNTELTLSQYQNRTKQLIANNQKLKIDLGNYQSIRNRCNQQQKQIANLKKLLRQKCQQLQVIQGNSLGYENLKQQIEVYRNKIGMLQKLNQEKQQEIRLNKTRIQEKQHRIRNLSEQIQEISKESIRIKELQAKIDNLFMENEKLHTNLLQKIGQIQDLQRRISILESKNLTITNQCTKVKTMYELMAQQLSQSESKLQNMKNRWETQVGAKMGLEQKCTRLSKEVVVLRTQITSLQQNNRNIQQRSQELVLEFQQKKLELYLQLDQLNRYKVEAETQLQSSNRKVQQLRSMTRQLKSQIQEQARQHSMHMLKIHDLESHIVKLTQQICLNRQQTQRIKKYWFQVQQVTSNALSHYK